MKKRNILSCLAVLVLVALGIARLNTLLRPVDTLFRQYPEYRIAHPRVEQLCRNGNAFTVKTPLDGGIYRVYGTEGDFLCLSRLENGQMTSIKNFFGA